MLSKSPIIHLRSFRKRAGLTQADLACLLSVKTSLISKYELRKLKLPIQTLFACCMIFDCTPQELYPGLLEEVALATHQNAKVLLAKQSGKNSIVKVKRKTLLVNLIQRVQ